MTRSPLLPSPKSPRYFLVVLVALHCSTVEGRLEASDLRFESSSSFNCGQKPIENTSKGNHKTMLVKWTCVMPNCQATLV